jgi:hypothetical protein
MQVHKFSMTEHSLYASKNKKWNQKHTFIPTSTHTYTGRYTFSPNIQSILRNRNAQVHYETYDIV